MAPKERASWYQKGCLPGPFSRMRALPNTTMVERMPQVRKLLLGLCVFQHEPHAPGGIAEQEILIERGQAVGGLRPYWPHSNACFHP